ncbi:hypothetical protein CEXT_317781 [Caerostris extrusa]|uniref:Uncharacterized protein n=1 Tax=Caerostris extrusa TaxID=172846 RepID=A0AAV4MYM5_CAEEX|nr:hypothetical protein CEXT_317781 [Caerostris extrusa]
MDWKHPGSSTTNKFKVTPSTGNVMANTFWILVVLSPGAITGAWPDHQSISLLCHLTRLHEGIRFKRPGMLSEGASSCMTIPSPILLKATQELFVTVRMGNLVTPHTAQI